MVKQLLARGILAGALAGLLAFGFARIFAEPVIQRAIDYESGRDAAQEALDKAAGIAVSTAGPDIFSRTVQANLGIGVGMVGFGAAMGLLFTVAYVLCLGRVGAVRPRSLAMLVALFGLLGMYVVPFVKYPANPPSVGHMETIRERSGLYLVMVGCSVLLLIAAVAIGQRLRPRLGNWNATLVAALGFVVVIGVVMALLPSFGHLAFNRENYGNLATETPTPLLDGSGRIVYPGFPADDLWSFRFYSLAAQVVLWGVLGLVFGPMAERVLRPHMVSVDSEQPAPTLV